MSASIYYNYIYVDPRKPGKFQYPNLSMCLLYEPFYIGKGTKLRYQSLCGRSIHAKRKIRKLRRLLGCKDSFIIVFNHTTDESNAYTTECNFIANIGRWDMNTGPLLNRTDGGDGVKGYQITDEVRLKISISGLGRHHTPEVTQRIGIASKKRLRSHITKSKLSQTIKAHWSTRKASNPSEAYKAKSYILTSPDNHCQFIYNLAQFCRDEKICCSLLRKYLRLKTTIKSGKYVGWTIKIAEPPHLTTTLTDGKIDRNIVVPDTAYPIKE